MSTGSNPQNRPAGSEPGKRDGSGSRLRHAVVRAALLLFTAVALTSVSVAIRAPAHRLSDAPSRLLWAWERPEDLGFLDSETTGVAFWAGTVRLRGDRVAVTHRRQSLATPAGTWRMAVVRLETDPTLRPILQGPLRRRTRDAILSLLLGGEEALQIDFDALVSERSFYRQLLVDLRSDLDPRLPLSITALASWCAGEPWLTGLPIDEAVPMLFRMGADGPSVRHFLAEGGDFSLPRCRASYGVSTDEPLPTLRPERRVYLFHPRPWEDESAAWALRRLETARGSR